MSLLDIAVWINTLVAIVGTFLNARQIRSGFIVWMITNGVFVGYDLYIHSYQQAALFGVYFVLAVYGWITWGKKAKAKK